MQSSNEDFTSEAEYLKRAAAYVGGSDIESAISLLERARLRVPITNRLINALGKLYLATGKPAKAAECFQSVLNIKPKFVTEVKDELPLIEDMDYLAEQSCQLSEQEYSFETPDVPKTIAPERKILSLGVKKPISDKKIVFKSRQGRNCHESPLDIKSTPLKLLDEPSQQFDPAAFDHLPIDINSNHYEFLPSDLDGRAGDLVELGGEQEEDFVCGYGISIVDELDVDLADVAVPEFIEGVNYESPELPNLADDFFVGLDIYDHWPDDLLDEDAEDDLDTGVLGDRISREQRAQQAAIECLDTIGWNKKSLAFLTDVFIELGWNNARKALQREVLAGATYEELSLAFDIKQIWAECDRYWITFTGAWLPRETTSATFRHCSWRQALRLIRVFNGIPSSEEVLDLIENEFESWYGNSLLRTRFPAFSKYLFSYRLNESLPTLPISEFRRFDSNIALDEMNASWTFHPLSDEVRVLSEYGVDVVNRYAPKSYYASDVNFDPRSLDKPKPQEIVLETVSDDEIF